VHVDAVAYATVCAIVKGRRGIYNLADPNGYLSTAKAQRELGFDAAFRMNDSSNDLKGRQRTETTTARSAV
jgi:hypothetical protein